MKSDTYIEFIKTAYNSLRFVKNLDNDFFEGLDDLRKVANKYDKEAIYTSIYPHNDIELLESLKADVIEVSERIKVIPFFFEIHHSRDTFVKFKIQGINITKVILI